tara:strand:- start:836 stop:1063 length:228 start_codon:yes stop_codon:yes gene_type:complete
MSYQDRRKMMIAKVKATIEKAGLEFDQEKFIAVMSAEEGVSRRTAMDYINVARRLLDDKPLQKGESEGAKDSQGG